MSAINNIVKSILNPFSMSNPLVSLVQLYIVGMIVKDGLTKSNKK